MTPTSGSVSLAARVLLVAVLAIASSPAEQAHRPDGAGQLNMERSGEATGIGGENRGRAAATISRWGAEERAKHHTAGGNGGDGSIRTRLRHDRSRHESASVKTSDVARDEGGRQQRTPSAAERRSLGSRVLATTAAPSSTVAGSASPTSPPAAILDESSPVARPGTVAAGAMTIFSVGGIILVWVGSLAMSRQGSGSRESPSKVRDDMEVGAVSASTRGSLDDQAQQHDERNRRPAVTLCFVVVTQLQFLATLSLVEHAVEVEGSLLGDFVSGLRWTNLWWAAEFAKDVGRGECVESAQAGDLGASVFVGNSALIMIALMSIFLLHVAVISGVEASWLAKKHAAAALVVAPSRPAPRREKGSVRFASEKKLRRTAPGDPRYRPSLVDDERRGENNGDLPPVQEESECSCGSSNVDEEQLSSDRGEEAERGKDLAVHNEKRLGPVETCREQSRSAWLHFPHVELVFLLFAFEGAVASQAAAIQRASCPGIAAAAGVALLLYPVLMLLVVCRIIAVRVRPDVLLAFKSFDNDEAVRTHSRGRCTRISFMSKPKLKSGWGEGRSLFSWADKGRWQMIDAGHHVENREHDWFRVGFEPVFVDYTKRGVWFIVVSLIEWTAIACIGVLVDASALQLFMFFLVKSLVFTIVVCLQPFANRIVNIICASVTAVNVFSTGLLTLSTWQWEEGSAARTVETTVVVLQLVLLCALLIPIYLDSMMILVGAVRDKTRKTSSKENEQNEAAGALARSHTWRQWGRAWCNMLRHNIVACARDTREGVRRPYRPSARTGPYPARASQKFGTGADRRPYRLSDGNIGTVNSPVTVLSGERGAAELDVIDGTSPHDASSRLHGSSSGRAVMQRGMSGCGFDVPADAYFERLAIATLEGRKALVESDDSGSDPPVGNPMPSATTGSIDSSVDRFPPANRPGSFFADDPGNSSPAETGGRLQRREGPFVFSDDVDSATPGRNILARGPSVGTLTSPAEIERESRDATWLVAETFKRRQSSENRIPGPHTPRGGVREGGDSDPDRPGLYGAMHSDDGGVEITGQCSSQPGGTRSPSVAPTGSASDSSPAVSLERTSETVGEAVDLGAVRCVGGGMKNDRRRGMEIPRVSWAGHDDSATSAAHGQAHDMARDGAAVSTLSPAECSKSPRSDSGDFELDPTDIVAARRTEAQRAQNQTTGFARLHGTAPWDSAAGSGRLSGSLAREPWNVIDGATGHARDTIDADDDERKDYHHCTPSKCPHGNGCDGEADTYSASGPGAGGERKHLERTSSTSFLAVFGVDKPAPIQHPLPTRRVERLTIDEATLPLEIISPGIGRDATHDASTAEDGEAPNHAEPAVDGEDGSNAIVPEEGGRGPSARSPPAAVNVSNRYDNYVFEATPPVRRDRGNDRNAW
ncbi:unnamed protein product [Scytosiphon promiscuus]